MGKKYKALDLFCGAGGVCAGLQQAGFEVTGVDIKEHPDYPGTFILGDATNPPVNLEDFDFVWASPPCQKYLAWGGHNSKEEQPDLMEPTRELLDGHPLTCIENVVTSPLRIDLALKGNQFGLPVRRVRHFELKGFECQPPFMRFPTREYLPIICYGSGDGVGPVQPPPSRAAYAAKHGLPNRTSLDEIRWALGVEHIVSGSPKEVRQALNNAIPPVYAKWIGEHVIAAIEEEQDA